MITTLVLAGCGSAPFELREPITEQDEEVVAASPVSITLRRDVDASEARVIWLVEGTPLGVVPGQQAAAMPAWATIDLGSLNLPIRARLESVDERSLVVTPLERPPPGRIQHVRVVDLRQGGDVGEVSLRFRTRRNPTASIRREREGFLCRVGSQLRYQSCTRGAAEGDLTAPLTPEGLFPSISTRTYTYDEDRLVEVVMPDPVSDLLIRETFTYVEGETPGLWELATEGEFGRASFFRQRFTSDDAGRVTEARLDQAIAEGGIDAGEVIWDAWHWTLDPDGRATRRALAGGQSASDPGEVYSLEEFVYDESGVWTASREWGPGSDGILDTTDDEVLRTNQRIFDDEGRLSGTLVLAGEGPDVLRGRSYERDENGFVSREAVVDDPGPDGAWLTSDDRLANGEPWFLTTFDADGQLLRSDWWSPGRDQEPSTDDDLLVEVTTFTP